MLTQEEDTMADQTELKKTPRLRWCGEGEPPTVAVIGTVILHLPSPDDQRGGFECEHGGLLSRQFDGYKVERALGAPAAPPLPPANDADADAGADEDAQEG